MSTAIVVSTGLNMVQYLSSLQDVDNYAGEFNKYARVKTDGTGIEWVNIEQSIYGRNILRFANGLTYNTYVDRGATIFPYMRYLDRNYLPVNRDGIAFVINSDTVVDNGDGTIVVSTDKGNKTFTSFGAEFIPYSELSLSKMNDVDDFSAQQGKVAKVKTDGTGVEWVEPEQIAVTPSGSTTERNIADIFGDIINVKNFGAKGDGVTGDTQAFLDADSNSPTGAAIYIPVTGNNYVLDGTTDLSSIKTISFGTIYFDISSGSTPPTHVNLIPV